MDEVSYILVGTQLNPFCFARLVRKRKGIPGSVEFNWKWVLEREEKKGDVLGFYHTHSYDREISGRDVKTMMAWVSCFAKTLLCIIEDFSTGKNKMYIFPPSGKVIVYHLFKPFLRISLGKRCFFFFFPRFWELINEFVSP